MKINKLKINAYGNIEDKEINLKQGINIIQGKNESGKSTLLNYIISNFYGISKTKDGRALADYDKYKPWNNSEFSGRTEYELDNGAKFEVFRDFNKKNPKIYNDKLEDISQNYEIDKKDGSKFFIEQTGVDKQMYLSTVVSMQEEVRLNEKEKNMLIQKIANLAGTGEEKVSYQKALTRLQDKIRDEIGTNKTSQKPINLIEREIQEIENKISLINPYQNRKYEIDEEKEKLQDEIKKLEIERGILLELKQSTNNEKIYNKEIEIKEKSRQENTTKIESLKKEEDILNNDYSNLEKKIEDLKSELSNAKENKERLENKIIEIQNRKIEEQVKDKSFIYIIIALICIIIGIAIGFIFKNIIITLVFAILTLVNTYCCINEKRKQSKQKKKSEIKRVNDIEEKNGLEEEKIKLTTQINNLEIKLKENEDTKQEINSKMSMIKGQKILLEKNNEKINDEIVNITSIKNNETYNKKETVLSKYKEQYPNLEHLESTDCEQNCREIEERINNKKIKVKGLEIENNTITDKLDEMVILDERLQLDKEKWKDLKEQEKIINIAIETLTEAYEEMKDTITPKFTQNLSYSINKISNDKYKKVMINDENGIIVENSRGEYIEAIKLSTGTIDQLYLALRLSMIDDLSTEKLPIILDESFAYFDNTRLANILKYLYDEQNGHQTIIFTCTNREKNILDELKLEYNFIEL